MPFSPCVSFAFVVTLFLEENLNAASRPSEHLVFVGLFALCILQYSPATTWGGEFDSHTFSFVIFSLSKEKYEPSNKRETVCLAEYKRDWPPCKAVCLAERFARIA